MDKFFKLIIKSITTFFYVGYLPLIPGTFGSLAGVFVYFLVKKSLFFYLGVLSIFALLGLLFGAKAEEIFKRKDARVIVIDEVVGMLLCLLFMPYHIKLVVMAFILFRILDALKPFPAGRLEKLKGGLGIMGDDIIAGLYTNIILQLVLRLAIFKTS